MTMMFTKNGLRELLHQREILHKRIIVIMNRLISDKVETTQILDQVTTMQVMDLVEIICLEQTD